MPEGNFIEGVSLRAFEKGNCHSNRFRKYEEDTPEKKKYDHALSPLNDYLRTFVDVSSEETLESIRTRALEEKRPVLMLELMGSGGAFDKEWLKGVAVSLTDLRKDKSGNNVQVLEENILERKTWDDINQWLKENKREGFDIVFCVPEYRGFKALGFFESFLDETNDNLTHDEFKKIPKLIAEMYFAVMNEAYKKLNEGGVLFFQWPDGVGITPEYYLSYWFETQGQLWREQNLGSGFIERIKNSRQKFPIELEIASGGWDQRTRSSTSLVKIVKNAGAPLDLGSNPYS